MKFSWMMKFLLGSFKDRTTITVKNDMIRYENSVSKILTGLELESSMSIVMSQSFNQNIHVPGKID